MMKKGVWLFIFLIIVSFAFGDDSDLFFSYIKRDVNAAIKKHDGKTVKRGVYEKNNCFTPVIYSNLFGFLRDRLSSRGCYRGI